ncbi:MAG: hypothetical protein GY768_26195 [Planctomycetaceae bacterium]|nr:hypothetical protein [Planctomycetaceae bacterium]
MGSIHFLIPPQLDFNANALECAYMVGSDGVPWESRVEVEGNRLVVTRDTAESGRLVMLWHVEGHGELALATSTLSPGDCHYFLPLELARGCLARLQSQLNTAEVRGFRFSDSSRQLLRRAMRHFVNASLAKNDLERSSDEAHASLADALTLTSLMGQNEQVTAMPESRKGSTAVWGAVVHDPSEAVRVASLERSLPNVVLIKRTWCDLEINPGEWVWDPLDEMVESLSADRFRVGCGPLLTLDRNGIPDWLYLWENDVEAIQSYVIAYVRRVAARYAGRFRFWLCAAGTNIDAALGLSEEQRLRLTVDVLENVRQTDRRTPILVGVKQPWGEYLGRASQDLTPFQFVDILVRGDLGLSAIALQIQIDSCPGCTLPRDLLAFNQMIDLWSQLGLPLVIFLSVGRDHPSISVNSQRWERITQLLELFSRKSSIHGVIWEPFLDQTANAGGLLTRDGQPKRIFDIVEGIAAGKSF